MKRVQAYIRTTQLEDVLNALQRAGIYGLSVDQTRGYGRQLGQTETFRGSSYALNLVPKSRLDIVVKDEQLEDALAAIVDTAQSGELGDGKIFVSEVVEAVRIRTGERGDAALEP